MQGLEKAENYRTSEMSTYKPKVNFEANLSQNGVTLGDWDQE